MVEAGFGRDFEKTIRKKVLVNSLVVKARAANGG
jgi:hypothetical protein